MEFKIGQKVRIQGDSELLTVITEAAYLAGTGQSELTSFQRRACAFFRSERGAFEWGSEPAAFIPARCPLSEVKTAEEAEAWVGEEVEVLCWGRVGKDTLGHHIIMDWDSQNRVFGFAVNRCGEKRSYAYPENLRPLTQEPVTPGEGKPAEATGGELVLAGPSLLPGHDAGRTLTREGEIIIFGGAEWLDIHICIYCHADTRCEDHAMGCENAPEPQEVIHCNVREIRRQEWIDELSDSRRTPYISPQELARIGRRSR